jgi:hypothetical protein
MLEGDNGADQDTRIPKAGAPAALRSASHGAGTLRGLEAAPAGNQREGRFGRMFPDLDPRGDVAPFPADLGRPGGPMDGGNEHVNSTSLFAIMTYFGQFIDHDITFDPTSSLECEQDPEAVRNFRTPMLELDSVYGGGPTTHPFLFDRSRPDKMLLGGAANRPEAEVDLPRNRQGVAIIGDPRNDENLIVSQLHVAFLKFHNAIVEQLDQIPDDPQISDATPLAKAQRLVRWHYQWLIVHEFLPAIVGSDTVSEVMKHGCKLYTPRYPFIPVEFSVAAYRFGHSMVQPGYAINDVFGAPLFPADRTVPPAGPGQPRRDLRGGPVRFEERVNWKNFLDTGAAPTPAPRATRFSSKIDTHLSSSLLQLPVSLFADPQVPQPPSLAVRNLARGVALKLPSGQKVAEEVRKKCGDLLQLKEDELWGTAETAQFKGKPAPLWYYFLREAEVLSDGEKLGPIGGRIVAEVLLGLLQIDSRSGGAQESPAASYLVLDRDWTPQLKGCQKPGKFTFADFFRIAGCDVD